MKRFRFLSLLVFGALLASLLAACGANDAVAPPSAVAPSQTPDGRPQPLTDRMVTFSGWSQMPRQIAGLMSDFNDMYGYQYLEELTNVHIEWQHPMTGRESEAFTLLMASHDYPDIMFYSVYYTGGIDKAIEDGAFLRLNEIIDTQMPNYKALLDKTPHMWTDCTTDTGNIGALYCIYDQYQEPWAGLITRKDWLDDLGLPMPETYDDWYKTLTAYKDQKGADAPLLLTNGADSWYGHIVGGYGFNNDFYQIDGKVSYGPIQPGYKDYLAMMNKWYKEGLIDPDFSTRTDMFYMPPEEYIYSGRSGIWFGFANVGDYAVKSRLTADLSFYTVGIQNPVIAAGERSHFRTISEIMGMPNTISAGCENLDLLVKWLDFCYGEEGRMALNYGREGHTYRYVNGIPYIDEEVVSSLYGNRPYAEVWQMLGPVEGAFYRIFQKRSNRMVINPESIAAVSMWRADGQDYAIPAWISMTAEEGTERSVIMSDINTYVGEMRTKFILGTESVDTFDEFVQKIREMNIDRAVEITQNALDRYNAR